MKRINKDQPLVELAAVVSDALTTAGLNAVLSGGSVVSVYSDNEYQSYDLDFVTSESTKDLIEVIKISASSGNPNAISSIPT